jgi:hypothetical protein
MCNQFDDKYFPKPGGDSVDQTTGKILLGPLGAMTPTTEYKTQKASYSKATSVISPTSDLAQNITVQNPRRWAIWRHP